MSNKTIRENLIDAKRQLTPRDKYFQQLKESVQGTPAAVKQFKSKSTKCTTLKRKWQPFQESIDAYIARKTKESGNLPEKISEMEIALKTECPHPVESTEVIESYHSGGYDYTARTEYYVKCSSCGAMIEVDTKEHGWYS